MAAPFHDLTPERMRASESPSGHGSRSGVSGMREKLSSINARINSVDAEAKRLANDEKTRLEEMRSRLSRPKSAQELDSLSESGNRGRQSAPADRRRAQSPSSTWGRRARSTPQSWPRRSVTFEEDKDEGEPRVQRQAAPLNWARQQNNLEQKAMDAIEANRWDLDLDQIEEAELHAALARRNAQPERAAKLRQLEEDAREQMRMTEARLAEIRELRSEYEPYQPFLQQPQEQAGKKPEPRQGGQLQGLQEQGSQGQRTAGRERSRRWGGDGSGDGSAAAAEAEDEQMPFLVDEPEEEEEEQSWDGKEAWWSSKVEHAEQRARVAERQLLQLRRQRGDGSGASRTGASTMGAGGSVQELAEMLKAALPRAPREQEGVSAAELKIDIQPLKKGTAKEAENSLFSFYGACEAAAILDVAQGARHGTPKENDKLARMTRRWVAKDEDIMQSLRIKFGMAGGDGGDMLEYVLRHFLYPVVHEALDPEEELLQFKWDDVFKGNGMQLKTKLDELVGIIDRQPAGRQADQPYWIRVVKRRCPAALAMEYDRYLRDQPISVQQDAAVDLNEYIVRLSKAMWELRRRENKDERDVPIVFSHQGGKCKGDKCGNKHCPSSKYDDAECDVHGRPRFSRMRNMRDNWPDYLKMVEEERKKAGRPALDFSKVWDKQEVGAPKVNAHQFDEEQEASLDDVLAAMSTRWHSSCCTMPESSTE